MACEELTRLRKDARALYTQLSEKTRRSFNWPADEELRTGGGKTDFGPFLKHQITLLTAKIEEHIAKHGCE